MRTTGLLAWLVVIPLLMAGTGAAAGGQPTAVYGAGADQFSLATGSPGELGLLKVLAETFGKQHNARMAWFKAGSGVSMKLLKDRQVDMIMVHAPAAEKQAVQDGWATKRILIGSNEFFIVGPAADPAKIAEAKTVVEAYRRIAAARAKFFSRGDNSGTHKKEMDLWKKAEITPPGRLVCGHQGFHDRHLEKGQSGKGVFHGGQQHLCGGKAGGPGPEDLVQRR